MDKKNKFFSQLMTQLDKTYPNKDFTTFTQQVLAFTNGIPMDTNGIPMDKEFLKSNTEIIFQKNYIKN